MQKAWVIAVDMGYGHQRAAYPLRDIAYMRIINANSDKSFTREERKTWNRFRWLYEGLSRFRSYPVIGKYIWNLYDRFQEIMPLYPFRDLSKPTFGALYLDRMIKKGFMKGLINLIREKELPVVSTFFAPAIAAAYYKIKNVYCIVTDTDINRIWVPKNPKRRITYLVPTEISYKRLIEYGVPDENIFYTGFPLPEENTSTAKQDLAARIYNLDLKKKFCSTYSETLKQLGNIKKTHPLTITFAVGGAGAQKEIGFFIMKSLVRWLNKNEIKLNLVAGTRLEVKSYYDDAVRRLHVKNVNVLFSFSKREYFESFNEILHTTDILWTKPSELVFYSALGIPLIFTEPLGSHEYRNREWAIRLGVGVKQENPKYVDEWLFDWLSSGILAEAAWKGYVNVPREGTENIKKLIRDTQ